MAAIPTDKAKDKEMALSDSQNAVSGKSNIIRTAPPEPKRPFPFLKLPRELRDQVYYYALLRPPDKPVLRACCAAARLNTVCLWQERSRVYWGTERSTRLFRVSHQVSVEALEAFYSRFPFHLCTRAAVVERLLGSLTARAKSLIREVIVNFAIYLRESPCGIEYDWRAGVERMMELLPNLRQVHLILHFRGYGLLRKHQESIVVERSVRIAGALKAVRCRRV